jgi:hypothetical protein
MPKPLNLPADLIKDWARRQTAASAKLEGRELPDDFVRSVQAQQFLNMRSSRASSEAPLAERIQMEALWG